MTPSSSRAIAIAAAVLCATAVVEPRQAGTLRPAGAPAGRQVPVVPTDALLAAGTPTPGDPLPILKRYLAAVRDHNVGTGDDAGRVVARWPFADLNQAFFGLAMILDVVRPSIVRDAAAGVMLPLTFRSRVMTRAQLAELLGLAGNDVFVTDPNAILRRGAMLHMDIALYVRETAPFQRREFTLTRHSTDVKDGQTIDVANNTLHWRYARILLDATAPRAAGDPWVRQWYLATTRWMAHHRFWSDELEHARHATDLFASDARFLFERGVVHEVFSMAGLQAAREDSPILVEPARAELDRAETLLRSAVTLDPSFPEGRLHHGRVLDALGRHREAEAELRQAAADLDDRVLTYYANLFLGHSEGALGDREAATARFERAATAFPFAQSPLLGLSQLARRADDGAAAKTALERLFALHSPHGGPDDDPWWEYDRAHGRDADAMVAALRQPFLTGGSR
jgi:hypothetical protein